MSYTALYRKFRPDTFEEVKGQEHIVTTLCNQVKTDKLGHAYLFCGTRGTGKTTVAKILAKAVNCMHPVEGSPCGECEMCQKIQAQTSMNVIEIDAASNNGVGNIRDIIEEVQYSPTEGRYKVYIIDEVHMLSTGAFNALLKTLEEPPSYVMFILATTEAHKIPITILSRCQRYDFKRISIDTIAARLQDLVGREGVETEEKALRYIAKTADGSMRDALSLLDRCIAFYMGQPLTYERVLEVLGAVDTEVYGRMFRYIMAQEVADCIRLVDDMMMAGRDLNQFIQEFLWYLRGLLLIDTAQQGAELLDVSAERLVQMKEEATLATVDQLVRMIHILSELSNQIRYATQKRVLLEVSLIKLCRPQMDHPQDLSTVLQRLDALEKKMEAGAPVSADTMAMLQAVSAAGAVAGDAGSPGAAPLALNATTDTGVGVAGASMGGSVTGIAPGGLQGGAMSAAGPSGIPQTARPKVIPKAVPEQVREIIAHWNEVLARLDRVEQTMLAEAKKVVGDEGTLVLQFTDVLNEQYFQRDGGQQLEELHRVITQLTGVDVALQTRTVDVQTDAQYDDLSKLIQFDGIEYV